MLVSNKSYIIKPHNKGMNITFSGNLFTATETPYGTLSGRIDSDGNVTVTTMTESGNDNYIKINGIEYSFFLNYLQNGHPLGNLIKRKGCSMLSGGVTEKAASIIHNLGRDTFKAVISSNMYYKAIEIIKNKDRLKEIESIKNDIQLLQEKLKALES